jgi:hypothetical protein
MSKSPIKNLVAAVNEKDVENAWRGFLADVYKDSVFTSPFKCDGYLVSGNLRMLCEFKYDPQLKTSEHYAVIGQAIYYLKKFIEAGSDIPNVIFVGDKNECFILPIPLVIEYTKKAYDWTISPCDAGKNIQMMADLRKDENINPFVFDVVEGFSWIPVHNYIERAIRQIKADIAITAKTIPAAFEYWRKNVMKHTLSDNEHIELFFKVMTNPGDCYKHPKKDGVLIAGDNEYKIDKKGFNGFFSLYKEVHNPIEIRDLTANKDRLIAEIARRRTGAFFTPDDWVDEAHKMLSEHLGVNYRDEYIFWDCSCGTANLTRNYTFKELYISTLEQTDLNIIAEAGYNKGATMFQFDFLNDSLDKLPEGLMNALMSGKKIVFLNNAPYSAAGNMKFEEGNNAVKGASDTMMRDMMDADGMGHCCRQLYAQFMYRVMKIIADYKLDNAIMANFSMTTFLNGPSFEKFRDKVHMQYIDGIMFQASHFADVSDTWGICFTIFKKG